MSTHSKRLDKLEKKKLYVTHWVNFHMKHGLLDDEEADKIMAMPVVEAERYIDSIPEMA